MGENYGAGGDAEAFARDQLAVMVSSGADSGRRQKPNPAHDALAQWRIIANLASAPTPRPQNVDDLHEQAGRRGHKYHGHLA